MKLYYNMPTGEYEFEVYTSDIEKAIAEIHAKEVLRKINLIHTTELQRNLIEYAIKTFLSDTAVLHFSKECQDFFLEYYADDLKEYFANDAINEYKKWRSE